MTYREETNLAKEAVEMILRGTDESEVEAYVYEKVGRNPYIFKDLWQKIMWMLEYFPERGEENED